MKSWYIAFGVVLAIFLILYGTLLILRAGPTAPAPTIDPLVRWNAEHAGLADNAADLYAAAFAKLTGEEGAWADDYCGMGTPVPPEAAAWVAQNAEALALARRAAQCTDCWFADLSFTAPRAHLLHLRTLARLLKWEAALAAAARDREALADALLTMDRIGRHAATTPLLIDALIGIACRALAVEAALEPLRWPELTAADRAVYSARLQPVLEPVNLVLPAFAGEQECTAWHGASWVGFPGRMLAPPERIAGELARAAQPLRALAAATLEEQCDPQSAPALRAAQVQTCLARRSSVNPARTLAEVYCEGTARSTELQARLLTTQRGRRLVLALWAQRDRDGAFPDTLAAADLAAADDCIDPYTGRPFVYGRVADTFMLYSCALDRDDDGGTHDERFGLGDSHRPRRGPPDGDFVFWPIPAR